MKKLLFICFSALLVLAASCRSKEQKATDQNYTIGQSKMAIEDYKGAVNAFWKCIKVNPNNADAYHQCAIAYAKMGDRKKALSCYHMAQRIYENHEDLKDNQKHAEYQDLLQEIKNYNNATNVTGVAPPPTGITDTAHRQ